MRSWALLGLAFCAVALADEPQLDLPRTVLRAGLYQLPVQVAADEASRRKGMMFRRNLPENEGMIFVFEQPAQQCFWMKNTPTPLDAAFLDDAGVIVNIEALTPFSQQSRCSRAAARYVIEVPRGWFVRRRIRAGMRIENLPQ